MLNLHFFGFTSVIPIIIGCDCVTCAFNSDSLFISESAFVYIQFILFIIGADRAVLCPTFVHIPLIFTVY